MANYVRPGARRFFVRGMSLIPQDALAPEEVGFIRNMRTYQDGTIEPRYGLDLIPTNIGDPVHSIFRLDDWTSFGGAQTRVVGANKVIYQGAVAGGPYTLIDNNYSGNPLTGVIAAPVASPKPWLYIGDSVRIQKIDAEGNHAPIGVHQPIAPSDEPTVTMAPLQILPLDADTDLALWAPIGVPAGPLAAVSRCDTTAASVTYDTGNTGSCSIVPSDFTNIIIGARLTIEAPGENIIVQSVRPAVGSTTIAAVIFDAGATGFCTIQPVTSLATGQLEAASFNEAQERYSPDEVVDPTTTPSLIRAVDFAVNSLVSLNGGAPVRVLSVAQGTNGVLSFRCYSPAALAAGNTIAGVASFRTTTVNTQVAGNHIFEIVNQQVLTASNADDPFVGGAQVIALAGGVVDASQITLGPLPRATQPEDDICLAFKANLLTYVNEVRFYLNVDASSTDFLTNYYMHAWRANDLISAIQVTNAGVTDTIQQARQNVVLQQNVDQSAPPGFTWNPPTFDDDGSLVSPGSWIPTPSAGPLVNTQGNDAIGLSTTSRQLALGNNEWILLRCKVSDLTRIGMDSTRTLADINGIQILVQIQGSTDPITVEYADFYLAGGFGPDVRETLSPYICCYRHRSSTTGAMGNPSPPLRGGMFPRRQRLTMQGTASTEHTVDLDDWFVRGGSLSTWTYAGTVPTGTAFDFDSDDQSIDGGPNVNYDHHQPWPVSDLPRAGACNVSGTAVKWVSGDTFNTGWAPGSAVNVNGLTGTIYAVASPTLLFLNENVGSGFGIAFTVPEPIILAQPLPYTWGGEVNGVVITFACGDPTDPTALHWTNGNDPDATTDANWLFVANEQMIGGGFYNRQAFVFSSENLYQITPTFGLTAAEQFVQATNSFRADVTPCGKGPWSPWAFCVTPYGFVFLGKDAVYVSNGGPATDLTDPDLRPIFPNEGTPGQTTRGVVAPDFSQQDRLRLAYIDDKVFFDYVGLDGNDHTLIYDFNQKGWFYDEYLESGIRCRLSEPGLDVYDQIMGAESGDLYQYNATSLLDGSTGIEWAVWTATINAGDARAVKQWGDAMLDCHPGSSVDGIFVTPVIDNGNLAMATVGIGGLTRNTYVIDFNNGNGALSRTFGLIIAGNTALCDGQTPLLYQWEPSFVPKDIVIAQRATDWEDLGILGAKYVQGVVIRANTYGVTKSIAVQYDGGLQALTLSLRHDGEQAIAYPLSGAGWTPFVAELVRLASLDDVDWTLLDWRWVFEPAPELATQWETQETTFDLPGFLDVRDAVVAYAASAPVTLRVFHDATFVDYSLPSTGGNYSRTYVTLQAKKGKSAKFRWTSSQPFRLFKRDCTVRVHGWGASEDYLQTTPFGGPSRADGAAI